MILGPGLHQSPGASIASTRRALEGDAWQVFVLPPGIHDKQSFIGGIVRTLPLDPPLVSGDNWDAIADSLWGGIDALEAERVAILWPQSELMASRSEEDFKVAKEILADTAESLSDRDATAGRRTQLMVLLG